MTGVQPEATVGREQLSRLQGFKCRRAAAVKARDQLQPTSAQSQLQPTSAHKNHHRVQAPRRGQANLKMRCRWGEDGGWVPLWYGWLKAVEWGQRLDGFMQ